MRLINENGLALTTLRTDARTDLATTKLYRNVTTITPHLDTAQVVSVLIYE